MKKKIVQFYGLTTSEFNEKGDPTEESFRVAFCNLNLTCKDGLPSKIPPTDFLYVGSIGSAYNSEKLLQSGITHVLCLSDVINLAFPEKFEYLRVPMRDLPDYEIANDLADAFKFINEAKSHRTPEGMSGKVLVHCYQGKSRSCAVCCAYLMTFYNQTLETALANVREVRPIAAPNSGFMKALRTIELDLYGKVSLPEEPFEGTSAEEGSSTG
jgi:atypical dual specificity phosphatase